MFFRDAMTNTNTIEFDPKVLQKFALKLYKKADNVVLIWTFFGIFFGLVAGVSLSAYAKSNIYSLSFITAGSISFLGLLGYSIGSSRAFKLRLEAQNVLCQVAIERNTRPASVPAAETPGTPAGGHGVFIC